MLAWGLSLVVSEIEHPTFIHSFPCIVVRNVGPTSSKAAFVAAQTVLRGTLHERSQNPNL